MPPSAIGAQRPRSIRHHLQYLVQTPALVVHPPAPYVQSTAFDRSAPRGYRHETLCASHWRPLPIPCGLMLGACSYLKDMGDGRNDLGIRCRTQVCMHIQKNSATQLGCTLDATGRNWEGIILYELFRSPPIAGTIAHKVPKSTSEYARCTSRHKK
jgi:hypothetical protein